MCGESARRKEGGGANHGRAGEGKERQGEVKAKKGGERQIMIAWA